MNRFMVRGLLVVGVLWGGYFLYQRTGPVPATPAGLERLDSLLREAIEAELAHVRGLRRSREAWLRVARMYEANALFVEAIRCYERILERWPDEARAAYHLGCSLEREGDLVRAREAMETAVALDPDYPGAWDRLASWSLDLGELDRAAEALELRRALASDDPTLGYLEVRLALGRRDHARALALIEERELSSEPYGQHLLALALRQAGDLRAAEKAHALGKGTRLRFSDPWTMEMMGLQRGYAAMGRTAGRMLQSGHHEKAIPLLEKVVAYDPEDARSLNMLGVGYMEQGDLARALELFERVLAVDPRHHDGSINYARTVVSLGTARAELLGRAEERLQAALERRPSEPAGWRAMASLEERGGRIETAIEALDRVAQLEPAATDVRLKAAYLLVGQGRHDESLERFRALAGEAPELLEARMGELTALVLAERKEEARRVLEELRGESVDPARMAKLKASIERLPWGRPGLVSRGGATPARSPRCPWR